MHQFMRFLRMRSGFPVDYNGELMVQAQKNMKRHSKNWFFSWFIAILIDFISLDNGYNVMIKDYLKQYYKLCKKNKYGGYE